MIEGSFVIPLVILSISLLIIISLMSLNSILFKEISYQEGIDLLVKEDYKPTANTRIAKVAKISEIKIQKSSGIIRDYVHIASGDTKQLKVSHIRTGPFIRKVDFAQSLLTYISQIKLGGTSMENLIETHKSSLEKLREKLR